MLKKVLEAMTIQEYNHNILFKEHYFEDKEWFEDMTDGSDLIQAHVARERS
jgi:hypothetical protein